MTSDENKIWLSICNYLLIFVTQLNVFAVNHGSQSSSKVKMCTD